MARYVIGSIGINENRSGDEAETNAQRSAHQRRQKLYLRRSISSGKKRKAARHHSSLAWRGGMAKSVGGENQQWRHQTQ